MRRPPRSQTRQPQGDQLVPGTDAGTLMAVGAMWMSFVWIGRCREMLLWRQFPLEIEEALRSACGAARPSGYPVYFPCAPASLLRSSGASCRWKGQATLGRNENLVPCPSLARQAVVLQQPAESQRRPGSSHTHVSVRESIAQASKCTTRAMDRGAYPIVLIPPNACHPTLLQAAVACWEPYPS
ncbi:uncharacterized protein BJ171DRAFT_278793 [Polychytrium aggregatum]|uniref:uncharacterized protein n=1 Tax=Polychytrium aggregatum TaxID=110093 RepID=UPI0022FEB394|nr:uncharacterized protein BJ171DRAFT_278793 [Polychytrium aggregatum]KAI9207641.1 hypothetical protein BJ171DRAFT_278793 [Polychytrium aggregatum]